MKQISRSIVLNGKWQYVLSNVESEVYKRPDIISLWTHLYRSEISPSLLFINRTVTKEDMSRNGDLCPNIFYLEFGGRRGANLKVRKLWIRNGEPQAS